MERTQTLDFVYFDAGGGHRSAALALQSVIASKGYNWNVRLVNLQEVLGQLDIFHRLTRIRMEDIYNLILAKGWTLGSTQLLPIMHGIIRFYHSAQVKLLVEYWKKQRPDMVVSLVPNFNRAIFEGLQRSLPQVPMVTVLTDLADYPPHFWMEKQPKQYFVCGTPRALQQSVQMGHPASRAFLTSGMILRPAFYEDLHIDREEERKRLGLDPTLPTGLVLFGGEGSNTMYAVAERLGNSSIPLQLIIICGRNARLKDRLSRIKTRNKLVLEGFTKQIPYFMSLADFFVGKPGPGSISEALQMKLPVIVEANAWTLPQERYNAHWIRENEVGIVLENFRQIESAVGSLLSGSRLGKIKERLASINNRAVFEIPPIFETILATSAGACSKTS